MFVYLEKTFNELVSLVNILQNNAVKRVSKNTGLARL